MRTFIAVDVSEGIAEAIGKIQYHLHQANADVGWVKHDNFHLTLKFLGEIADVRAGEVKSAMDLIAQQHVPFGLKVYDLGCFPERGAPRVVWAGVTDGREQLAAIAHDLEEVLGELGFARENRAFTAHLTLGRMRSPRGGERLRVLIDRNTSRDFGSCNITALRLYKSTLAPGGSIYEVIHESALKSAA